VEIRLLVLEMNRVKNVSHWYV